MPSDKIRVRTYNVGFGDCLLVTLPDGAVNRNIMIDFGNAPGKSGSNEPFEAIAENIRDETGGHLDAIVVTHEHLDHVEGFRSQKRVFDGIDVDYVWMGLPSHPKYYRDFPNARRHLQMKAFADRFSLAMKRHAVALAPSFEAMLLNNISNVERLDYVRGLPKKGAPLYLARGSSVRGKPFSSHVKIRVLAPEKDVSVYYGNGGHAIHLQMNRASMSEGDEAAEWGFQRAQRVLQPANLSATDWKRLRDKIQTGGVDTIRAIDKAQNNTSLVFLLEAGGKRLLFTGDAEVESWDFINRKCRRYMEPVDFLKVSHHGSHNGTPRDVLDKLLPVRRKRRAAVVVSTKSMVYGTTHPVPDAALMTELRRRCYRLISTDQTRRRWIDVFV